MLEILAYNKSALCHSASLAFSFVLPMYMAHIREYPRVLTHFIIVSDRDQV